MQSVLITGASRGIGKALAQKFLDEGFRVLGTSVSGTLDYAHENLEAFPLDLRSSESIAACVDAVARTGVQLDILVDNAGVLLDEDETVLVPELLRGTLEVNVTGTAAFTERMLPSVRSTGHVVMISSTAGSLERVSHALSHWPYHYPAYKISKAALNMYMRTLALRLANEGGPVVSAVHPGWVRTDIGGEEADISPEEAASDIYAFAVTRPAPGKFWFRGQELPW